MKRKVTGRNGGILYPFEKGKSGNPKGKPKGTLHSKTRLKRFLELEEQMKNPITKALETMTLLEVMDLVIISKARKGDLNAYREILNRLEGTPVQSIDHTTGGEKLITEVKVNIIDGTDGNQST